jgi:hypothetical protein
MRMCVIDGCGGKHYGRGWCRYHYQQHYLSGRLEDRPRVLIRPDASIDARLRNIGWTVTDSGCWEWKGSRNRKGYGQLAANVGRPITASRAAYEEWVGPAGMLHVLHRCDNPPCVNPDHMFLGTIGNNADDMVSKKRSRNGERRPQHKLTDAEVAEIRHLRATTGLPYEAIGQMYGVTHSAIGLIIRGQRRQHPTHPIPKGQQR